MSVSTSLPPAALLTEVCRHCHSALWRQDVPGAREAAWIDGLGSGYCPQHPASGWLHVPAEPPAAWTEKAERVIYAHYTCECGCEGADPERAPGVVDCWQCGRQPSVTARNFAYV